MPKKPLHLIVAEYLSRFPGKQMTITEIGQNIASEYKSNFQNKEINLPKGATLGGQLAREIYSQKSKILSRHPQLDIDASHRPMRLFYDNNA